MPRPNRKIPAPHHHRASKQVRVCLNGKHHYCGPWDDDESHEKAKRLIADWLMSGAVETAATASRSLGGLSIAGLILAYVAFAESYYVRNGVPTRECDDIKDVLRHVRGCYGTLPVAEFGPLKLKAIREVLIGRGLSRKVINQRIGRVKRCFKWGVENELVPPSVFHGLQAVAGLRIGRSLAPEAQRVLPVETAAVNATLPHLSPVVAAMVRFQAATGCRPGEVCQLRPCDVSRDGEVWTYRPQTHKTQHHGRDRIIYIGPKGQRALLPFLDNRPADVPCFSPAEADAAIRAAREQARRTPGNHGNRRGTNRKTNPRRKPGDAYDTQSYGRAIRRAVEAADKAARKADPEAQPIPVWSPNQLRHAAATAIRREFGLEGAQVALGHAAADVTQIYAERDADLARQVAAAIG
ncbi:MAG: site-specific integrase [Planctomycetaceae bacterium]